MILTLLILTGNDPRYHVIELGLHPRVSTRAT